MQNDNGDSPHAPPPTTGVFRLHARGSKKSGLSPINTANLGEQQIRNLRARFEAQGYTVTVEQVR